MLQWINQNKEWVFSGAGVAVVSFVLWLIGYLRTHSKRPLVTVSPALAGGGGSEPIDLLTVTIQNRSERPLYLGNVMIELDSGQNVFFDRDGITGEAQHKRKLDAGDSFTFHLSKAQLLTAGVAPSHYMNIQIANAAGGVFRAKEADFKKVLGCVLSH